MQALAVVGAALLAPKTLVLPEGKRSIMTVDIRTSPSQKNNSQTTAISGGPVNREGRNSFPFVY
ncbi:MAG: hypothetical protein ACK6B2_07850 [Planctomycetota bacterium]